MAGLYTDVAADGAFPFDTADFAVLRNRHPQADPYVPISPAENNFPIPGAGTGAAIGVPDLGFAVSGVNAGVSAPGGTLLAGSGSGELPPAEMGPGHGEGGAEVSPAAAAAAVEHSLLSMGMVAGSGEVPQWDNVSELQRALAKAVTQRDEARMALSTLKNELYAAKQVEKRLRGERDEARGQVGFLQRERAAARQTELRLRKERDQARLAAALGMRVGKAGSQVMDEGKGRPARVEGENTEWLDQHEGIGVRNASPALCSPFEENFMVQFDNMKP